MGKGNTENAIKRQWSLLKLLPVRGSGLTSTELARKYCESQNISFSANSKDGKNIIRKIQRDMEQLEDVELVECPHKDTRPFGWRLNRMHAYFSQLSDSEALFLTLSERSITPLLPPNIVNPLEPLFDKAKEVLTKSSRSRPALKNRIASVPNHPLMAPSVSDEILEEVHDALVHKKVLFASYQASYRSNPKEMKLHILGLFQNGPSTYLIARSEGKDKYVFFALHRFKSASASTLKAEIPKNFNINDMLETGELQFGSKGSISLGLIINKQLATILEQTPLSEDQTIKDATGHWGEEKCYQLKATVNQTWDLKFWILSQSPNIEVIKPKKFRHEIAKELNNASARYNNSA